MPRKQRESCRDTSFKVTRPLAHPPCFRCLRVPWYSSSTRSHTASSLQRLLRPAARARASWRSRWRMLSDTRLPCLSQGPNPAPTSSPLTRRSFKASCHGDRQGRGMGTVVRAAMAPMRTIARCRRGRSAMVSRGHRGHHRHRDTGTHRRSCHASH